MLPGIPRRCTSSRRGLARTRGPPMNKGDQATAAQPAPAKAVEGSLLDQIVEEGRFGRETAARERGKDMVKEFIAQVVAGEMTLSRDADATINARIAQIDHL